MASHPAFGGVASPGGGGGSYTGPLDIVSGAVIAYGQRALSSAMRGQPLYTLRRDSDDTTQEFSSDATTGDAPVSAMSAFVGGGAGFLATWNDQSGSANNLVQATLANQPIWEAVESELNNKPAFSFSTNSGDLTVATAGDVTYPSGQMTIFMVVAGDCQFHAQTTSPNVDFESGQNAFNDMFDGSNEAYGGYNNLEDSAEYTIFETVWEFGSNVMLRNGVALTRTDDFDSGGAVGSISAKITLKGNDGYATIAAVLAWPSIISSGNRTLIRQNIADGYAITLP